jgi:hypothetical protein
VPKKQTLTVAELKSILNASFSSKQSKQVQVKSRLSQVLGTEPQDETPEIIAAKKVIKGFLSDTLARRLKRNRRTTPLFSNRDLAQLVPSVVDEIAKSKGDVLAPEERKMIEGIILMLFQSIIKMMLPPMRPGSDPYEEYWRWIRTVLALSAERGVTPAELFALVDPNDEITRRMFTKKQFVALNKATTNKLLDAEALKASIIKPMLSTLGQEFDDDERREIERTLEDEIMPELRDTLKRARVVVKCILDEEVKRIYGAR